MINFVSLSNQEQLTSLQNNQTPGKDIIVDAAQIDDLQFNPPASVFLRPSRLTESNGSRNQVKSASAMKRTGLMDPATFKLVLKHQKEYSLLDKAIQSHNPATIIRTKKMEQLNLCHVWLGVTTVPDIGLGLGIFDAVVGFVGLAGSIKIVADNKSAPEW